MAVTGRAKTAIRKALREEDRERFIKLGRELVRVAFDNVDRAPTDKALITAGKSLGLGSVDDLLEQVGAAEITSRDVVTAIYPELAKSVGQEIEARRAVIGLAAEQTHRRGQCCQPVPGERIVGITYRGQGVVVHAIDCEVLADLEDQVDRWIDLHWQEGTHSATNNVSLELTITNDAGVLGRICSLIGEHDANISDLAFIDRKPDYYRLLMEVDLRDVEHMHIIMTALEADTNVASIERHRDPSRAGQVQRQS